MQSDREMLELAAKAAFGSKNFIGDMRWNPLTDDGDALRLAVKLGIQVRQYPIYDQPRFAAYACEAKWDADAQRSVGAESLVNYDGDPCAATRRAIVRAAAAIGESMNG